MDDIKLTVKGMLFSYPDGTSVSFLTEDGWTIDQVEKVSIALADALNRKGIEFSSFPLY